jgi:hypothetical protein
MNNTAYAAGRTTTRAAVSTVKTAGSAVGTLGVALGSFLAGVAGVEPTAQQAAPANAVANAFDKLLDDKFAQYGFKPVTPKEPTMEEKLAAMLDERFAKLGLKPVTPAVDHPAPAAVPAPTTVVDQNANIIEALNQLRANQESMAQAIAALQQPAVKRRPGRPAVAK